jgi:hypothetical protein
MKEKRKKRVRTRRPQVVRTLPVVPERAFKMAARASLSLGAVLIIAAVLQPYLPDAYRRLLGQTGNLALRMAGIALIIATLLFRRARR